MKTNRHRNRNEKDAWIIIALAYFLRYGFPFAVVIIPIQVCPHDDVLLWIGAGCLVYALYWLMGYLLKWRHFYCAYQNVCHRPMTPFSVNWNEVRKNDIYIPALIFGLLGIAMIVLNFLI